LYSFRIIAEYFDLKSGIFVPNMYSALPNEYSSVDDVAATWWTKVGWYCSDILTKGTSVTERQIGRQRTELL